MNRTIVQLRERRPSARLLYGIPDAIHEGTMGPLATFGPGALVAYAIASSYRHSLLVFRTLVVDDPLAVTILGVRPHVQLLLDVNTTPSIRRTRQLLADLVDAGHAPEQLSDAFWGRVSTTLRGRAPTGTPILSLLRSEPMPLHRAPETR